MIQQRNVKTHTEEVSGSFLNTNNTNTKAIITSPRENKKNALGYL